MKKLLFTLLLLPFITFAQLDIPSILTFYEDDNFEYRDNLIFKKSSNSPYTGRVLTYSNSGDIIIQLGAIEVTDIYKYM
jgi:hypothetical protein